VAPDASPNDSQITLAEFEEVCGIAQGLREQLDAARAQAAQEKTAAQASLKAEKAATEQLQTHKAKLLADETRKAKETLQELRKKLASGNASSKSKDSSGKAGAGDPAPSRDLDSDAMDVDPGLVSDSLTRIKDLEARLEQSQTALKRFADPQKSNMMGNAPPTHAAKRQKLDSAHHAPSLGAKGITRKTDSDRGVVTASRLGYEAEDSDTCALRDASVCAVREGKLDLREFNQQMAQLHSNMGLQSNDGGVVRANSDRYRADGASDGPLGLEFGYNLRDQNPQMLSRIQGMVNQRTARDLIHGAQTTLHHTQRYAQQLY
jgi:hypothetical protein